MKRNGLEGHFLCGSFVLLLLFRDGLLSAIELQDRRYADLPDALFRLTLFANVLPAPKLAFHLDVCAFRERAGELRELAKDDATVPFSVRDILAVSSCRKTW